MPETLPVIVSVSAIAALADTLRTTVPPPSKLPLTDRDSFVPVPEALARLSVPPSATVRPLARVCEPVPKLIVEPSLMMTVSHPLMLEL